MPSTYSSNLRIEKMATGENRSTWGSKTNTNWELMEDAVSGWVDVSMGDANYSLTTNDGSTDEARQLIIKLTGAHTGTHTLTIPTSDKAYVMWNGTTGGYDVTVSNGSNSVTLSNGHMCIITTDGTNVYKSLNLFNFNGTAVIHDDVFLVSDPADETKVARIDLGGVTTASTRVMTWPDYNFTPASLAGTETLTNKTLTSPAISGPTLSGTATGTYTLGGTPTISSPTITSPTISTSISLPASAVDAITEIASAIKTGIDAKLVTGTAGTAGNAAVWDANGDLIDGGAGGSYQPLDATLTSISSLGTAADKIAYTTGVDTWAEASITAGARSMIALSGTANTVPYWSATDTAGSLTFSTSASLGTSDTTVSSQNAVKSYVDSAVSGAGNVSAPTSHTLPLNSSGLMYVSTASLAEGANIAGANVSIYSVTNAGAFAVRSAQSGTWKNIGGVTASSTITYIWMVRVA